MEPNHPDHSGNHDIHVLGVPMDLGAGRRGVDMGPSAIRLARLEKRLSSHLGLRIGSDHDIQVPIPEEADPGGGPRYLPEILKACRRLAFAVEGILDQGGFPLVLGGDHSIAIGTVTGVASHARKHHENFGLIWFDAHGDMNTPETSPTQNIHGMPLATLLGLGAPELVELGGFQPKLRARNVALIGIRNLDARERQLVNQTGVHPYTMRDIDERGIAECVTEALERVCDDTAGFHLSFDIDGLDPDFAPGVGTPVRGGIAYREAHLMMEMIADTGAMRSMEITELNPILDDRNQTAEVAVDLILSALGKRIL